MSQDNHNSNYEGSQYVQIDIYKYRKSIIDKYKNCKDKTGENLLEGSFGMIPENFIKYGKHLTLRAKWVYAILRKHYNYESGQCDQSLETISTESGLGETTVKKAIKELETFGWVFRYNLPRKKIRGKTPKLRVQFDLKQPLRIDRNGKEHFYYTPTAQQAAEYKKKPTSKFLEKKMDSKVLEEEFLF